MHWRVRSAFENRQAYIVPQPSPVAVPRGGVRGEGPQMFNHKTGAPAVLLPLTGTLTKSP
eukprot:6258503-Pyramimonas_sp.AAC.1